MGEVSNDRSGPKTISVYNLCKRDSLIVVAQLCPEFTARIVDRWQELEAQAAQSTLNPANMSRLQLLELAMQAEQERLALEHQVAEQAPQVAALKRISAGEGSQCITAAAKVLKVAPKKLFAWLQMNGWIYRRAGGKTFLGYQSRVNQGILEHRLNTIGSYDDGTDFVAEQFLMTPKGMAHLAKIFTKSQEQ